MPNRPAPPVRTTTVDCPECGAPMRLRKSKYGPFYGCSQWPACQGTHGAHPDGKPLGVPGTLATKRARMGAHDAFDAWWRGKKWSRRRAYVWLAEHGPKPHIAEMNADECAQLVALIASVPHD